MTRQTYPHLQQVIVTAICDESFCNRLLNSDRGCAIAAFELAQDEREALLAIRADSLETFAQELLQWIKQREASPPFQGKA